MIDTTRVLLVREPKRVVPTYAVAVDGDVRADLLQPSETRSICAYKGRASYFSLDDEPEIAWTYPEPLREAAEIADRVAFFNELADIAVDGLRRGAP